MYEGTLDMTAANRPRTLPSEAGSTGMKRIFDLVGSACLILLLMPVLVPLAIAIMLEGGPAMFSQDRIGYGGRRFRCYKFRTMVVDAEARLQSVLDSNPEMRIEWERAHKLRNDPRVTRVGRLLRKTSLDELPQLFNVFKGDMSLVGPRPILPNEIDRYGSRLSYYTTVRPGMTGLWQVSGRASTAFVRRIALDIFYVKNRSLWMDLRILLMTVRVVLTGRGAY